MREERTATMPPVAITGIGLVTPLGWGRERTWRALVAGESAVGPFGDGYLAARVPGLDVPEAARLLSLSFPAVAEALADSGVLDAGVERGRVGCTVSVSKPNLAGASFDPPLFADAFHPWETGRQLARVFSLGGPVRNVAAACATGADSVVLAAQLIADGAADVVLAGAAESSLQPLYRAGFAKMGVFAETAVRPFDRRREGFAMGEGAGVFVVERKDRAVLRGARIYGELAGYALACDTHHVVSFDESGEAIARAAGQALGRAGLEAVDYVNAHGTGTVLNDRAETRALKRALGAGAAKTSVSSTKAATGHLLGASGAVELAFCLLAMRDATIPPTLNLEAPDPDCDLDYTPNRARLKAAGSALSLSFGFGGQITALVVRR